ncbi:MAG TPA: type II secretion system F family protein [Vicinamibacterales bacterium]|nr:type II secretion system F family protein [Vicinamibacterales bacterium]
MITPSLVLALLAVFAAVAIIAGSLTFLSLERSALSPIRRRLEVSARSALRPESVAATSAATVALFKRVSTFIPKSPKQMTKLQRRLSMAGYTKPQHVVVYSIAEVALAVMGFLIPMLIFGLRRGMLYSALGAIAGYLAPGLIVDRATTRRQKAIRNGLPDALDLLIVCLEAGLALDQAILKCSEELQIAHPQLAEEMRLINVETRAGKPRLEAFKNFASRTGVDDVRALVSMLIQTDRFGTSIAQALRTHAEVSRTKRRQRAEEAAAKIGVKLVFPLVFCLFPAFYVVTLGPAVIKFSQAFGAGGFASGGLK